jgi:hypothetical protein
LAASPPASRPTAASPPTAAAATTNTDAELDIQATAAGESTERSDEATEQPADSLRTDDENEHDEAREEGPVHRPLIRASLPRPDGQPPAARPIPEFTIRQPGGRANRFRPRHQRGGHQGHQFQGNRSNGGGMRQGGGRPPQGGASSRMARRHGPGRKRSK